MPRSFRSESTESFKFFCSASYRLSGLTRVASILPWSMTRMRLLDSANPVARIWMSLPGVKPSFCSTRRVANSMVVPGRLMPTVLPRSSCAEAIDGLAASFHAEGPNVPMIASGSARADRRRARGDDDQIDVQSVFFEKPGIFGDPQRYPAAGDRRVGRVDRFERLGGRATTGAQK